MNNGNGTERRSLTREHICNVTLEAIDKQGLESISMRGLAQELGIKASSLYYHFDSKEDLLAGVADSLLSALEGPSSERGWIEQIRVTFLRLHRLVRAHPNAAPLVLRELMCSETAMDRVRPLTRGLAQAGLSALDSTALLSNLVALVVGHGQLGVWAAGNDEVSRALNGDRSNSTGLIDEQLFESGVDALIAAYVPERVP